MHRLIMERNFFNFSMSKLVYSLKPKLSEFLRKAKNISLVSEDYIYKKSFIKKQIPKIYEKHVETGYVSCAFCANLTRSHCHIHCLKCSAGTYIHCSPLLPGLMYNDKINSDETEHITVPWLFKKTCSSFQRLDPRHYLKNFNVPFSWVTVHNYEVYEGITCGYSSKERPCYICATIDYSIYRKCTDSEDFDKFAPCSRISAVIQEAYHCSTPAPGKKAV